ncbi:hypothetical protein DXG01_015071 [Tephrocybe rancida]|nr:hypothetical protein DXG01_015071 [Tephrocybe rancida]
MTKTSDPLVKTESIKAPTMELDSKSYWVRTADNLQTGLLLIYNHQYVVRSYQASKAGVALRSLAWHPTETRRLLVGCLNRDVITLQLGEQSALNDIQTVTTFPGPSANVYMLQYNPSGTQTAVAYSDHLCVATINGYSMDGVRIEVERNPKPTLRSPLVRGFHYLDDNRLLVTFHDPFCGIKASSALSPSGSILAVLNFRNSIDWYEMKRGRYQHSTHFDIKEHYMTSIQSTGKGSVICTHSRRMLISAHIGMLKNPERTVVMKKTNLQKKTMHGNMIEPPPQDGKSESETKPTETDLYNGVIRRIVIKVIWGFIFLHWAMMSFGFSFLPPLPVPEPTLLVMTVTSIEVQVLTSTVTVTEVITPPTLMTTMTLMLSTPATPSSPTPQTPEGALWLSMPTVTSTFMEHAGTLTLTSTLMMTTELQTATETVCQSAHVLIKSLWDSTVMFCLLVLFTIVIGGLFLATSCWGLWAVFWAILDILKEFSAVLHA